MLCLGWERRGIDGLIGFRRYFFLKLVYDLYFIWVYLGVKVINVIKNYVSG